MALFGGTQIQLTPKVALVSAMVYISAADGTLDDTEAANILRVVADQATLNAAVRFCKRNTYDTFLEQATRVLSAQQKLCVIINCADLAMGDGYIAPPEQRRLQKMAHVFEISESRLQPFIETLMIKNNLQMFH